MELHHSEKGLGNPLSDCIFLELHDSKKDIGNLLTNCIFLELHDIYEVKMVSIFAEMPMGN